MLRLQSGFELDYANIYNESCIQERDVNNFERLYKMYGVIQIFCVLQALKKVMFLKMVYLNLCCFYQLPYISEDGINTPDMLERLYELRDYARHNIDTVVSVGIGGSYLGSKVILMCNVEHFGITTVQRNATAIPRMYFAGFNVDGDYLVGLIRTLECQAQKKGPDYKVMLVINSKSGSTIEPMANFMILEKAFTRS